MGSIYNSTTVEVRSFVFNIPGVISSSLSLLEVEVVLCVVDDYSSSSFIGVQSQRRIVGANSRHCRFPGRHRWSHHQHHTWLLYRMRGEERLRGYARKCIENRGRSQILILLIILYYIYIKNITEI